MADLALGMPIKPHASPHGVCVCVCVAILLLLMLSLSQHYYLQEGGDHLFFHHCA